MTFISGMRSRFAYFDAQLERPPWASLRVLDFGGNAGNLLCDPACTIHHENYWSLDVSPDAVRLGRRRFPRANFVFYDRFHPVFNPGGVRELPVALPETFDVIVAFSVMTHLSNDEAVPLWESLRDALRPCGMLAFTFMDPSYRPAPRLADNLRNRCRHAEDVERGVVAVVDGEIGDAAMYPERAEQFDVLHTCDFMQRLFPDAEIRPPVLHERQHCVILRSGDQRQIN